MYLRGGTWIELYGTNLATGARPWGGDDFKGSQAPTELDGVKVTIGGRSAYVAFISPNQINAQVPDGIAAGPLPVIVTNANGASEAVTVTAAPASPALLAPPVFSVGGVQYAVALHQDGAFVGRDGLIADANFRPAQAGDVITLYGVGFGATSRQSLRLTIAEEKSGPACQVRRASCGSPDSIYDTRSRSIALIRRVPAVSSHTK